jgi:hypothetical protein
MSQYRINNWAKYNRALINRVRKWYAQDHAVKKGYPQKYSKIAIQCALTIRSMYHLPFRGTQGFLILPRISGHHEEKPQDFHTIAFQTN